MNFFPIKLNVSAQLRKQLQENKWLSSNATTRRLQSDADNGILRKIFKVRMISQSEQDEQRGDQFEYRIAIDEADSKVMMDI